MPRWLTVTLAAAAAAALVVLSTLLGGLHGWPLVVGLAFAALFTSLAIALPQLQQWQAQQAARLDLRLEVDRPTGPIPHYADNAGVIDGWLAEEQSRCLASLRRWEAPVEPHVPSISGSMNADKLGKHDDRPLAGVKLGDILRLQDKQRNGQVLTDDEARIVAAATKSIYTKISAIIAGASSTQALFSDPDTRSADEYNSQLSTHLSSCREVLHTRVLWAYVTADTGLMRLTIHNPTDRPFESVEVEVHLPGQVQAVDPEDVHEPSDEMPRPPKPFGERTLKTEYASLGGSQFLSGVYSRPRIPHLGHGPHIDNSGSATITYEPFTLRPQTRQTLADIHLRITEPPGTVIECTWEAASTNAEGRVKGLLRIAVSAEPLPVKNWLTCMIDPENST